MGTAKQRSELLERQTERIPAVAQLERAAERARAPPPEPDRYSYLHPTRIDDEAVEAVVGPGIGRRATAEGRAQRAEPVLVAGTTARERGPEERELLLERPDSNPQDEPSTRENVERPVALGDRERVVVREHEYVGHGLEPGGLPGEEAEGRERVVVARPAHRSDVLRDRDVLAAGHVVIAQTIGGDGDARDLGRPGILLPRCLMIRGTGDDGRDEAEAHPFLLPRSRPPRQQRHPGLGTPR